MAAEVSPRPGVQLDRGLASFRLTAHVGDAEKRWEEGRVGARLRGCGPAGEGLARC